VSPVPLLGAITDNLPGLLFFAVIIIASIVQQVRNAKKSFDKAVVRQRAERDAATPQPGTASAGSPPNTAQARALLLSQIDTIARNAAAAQSAPAPAVRAPQRATAPPQPAHRRSAALHQPRTMYQDPMITGRAASDAAAAAVDRSFATLPGTLGLAETSGALLTTASTTAGRSSTRRMLATAFGDPAHARSSVILAEVLGTPVGLR
jgi:hypothetical protein